MANAMSTGKVKFYNASKGFGFIKIDDSDEEIFVHISDVPNATELEEGQAVSFEIGKSQRGPRATNVVLD